MDFKTAQAILMKDQEYAREYEKIDLPLEVSKMITNARIKRNITQKKLAQMIHTGQSSIARAENGDSLPSLSFLDRIAKALKMVLLPPYFIPVEEANLTLKVTTKGVTQETKENYGYENNFRYNLKTNSPAPVFA